MATEVTYSGDGSNKIFNITFPFLKSDDVKVQIGDSTLAASAYSITGTVVTTDTAPASGTNNVKLYRVTPIDSAVHDYSAGSTIRAKNLNDNQKQVLYGIEEAQLVSVTSGGITTGAKNDIHVNSDTDWFIRTGSVEQSMLANNSVGSDEIINDSITHDKLKDSADTDSDRAVTTNHIRDGAVTQNKINNDAVTYEKIQNVATANRVLGSTSAGGVVSELEVNTDLIAGEAITEAKLKADNDPADDKVLTAKSSAAGGLTWQNPVITAASAPSGFQVGFAHMKTSTQENFTSNNTWTDCNLVLAYTPKLATSLIVLEARAMLNCRAVDEERYAYYEARFELDGTDTAIDGTYGVNYGWAAEQSGYAYYATNSNLPLTFTGMYSNTSSAQKTFRLQLRAPDVTTDFKLNYDANYFGKDSANSYFIIREMAP
jgi:hypothetical protein